MTSVKVTRRVGPAFIPLRQPVAVFVVLVALFVLLAELVSHRWPPLRSFDQARLAELNLVDLHVTGYLAAMRTVSLIASTAGWVTVLGAAAVYSARGRRWRDVGFIVLAGSGSPLLNALLKDLVHRRRPMLEHPMATARGWSFPSGHAQAATVGCAVLLIVFLPRLGPIGRRFATAAGVGVVGLVALSRVSLGVHYPSDVCAAVLCGLAWTLAVARLIGGPIRPSGPVGQDEFSVSTRRWGHAHAHPVRRSPTDAQQGP